MKLTTPEILLIAIYFVVMLGIGLWYRRASAESMESYFLGDRTTPWWMLGLSGSVSNFDIAGTTWIVGMFYFLGFRAFNMFWAFAFLVAAFLASYLAAWIRRTQAMTAAELIHVRFGTDLGGRLARSAAAIATSAFFLFALGYSFVGLAKFFEASFDYDPRVCATVLMVLTGAYVLLGGFRGVILSDVIQAVLLNICGVLVAVVAFATVDSSVLHERMSPSLLPVWSAPELARDSVPESYRIYALFGPFFLLFLSKGLLSSAASPGGCYEEQRFLATASPRDAALTGAAWGGFLVFRWLLVGAIVFLAITKLDGVEDPEQVLAKTVFDLMPQWLRGLLVTGFLAAFMSTFSSTLNGVSSIVVRDIVQPQFEGISERRLVQASYLITAVCVATGIGIGWQSASIQHIWLWMQLALMPSLLFPNILRWYWWRTNGWGYTAGVACGLLLATLQYFKQPIFLALGRAELYETWTTNHFFDLFTFPMIGISTTAACIAVSLMTRPTDRSQLSLFFNRVRPKGFWKPIYQSSALSQAEYYGPNQSERPWRIVLNILLAKIALLAIFVGPLYLVGHWYSQAMACGFLAVASSLILHFTLFRRLRSE